MVIVAIRFQKNFFYKFFWKREENNKNQLIFKNYFDIKKKVLSLILNIIYILTFNVNSGYYVNQYLQHQPFHSILS